jgi:hypothetical protein
MVGIYARLSQLINPPRRPSVTVCIIALLIIAHWRQ